METRIFQRTIRGNLNIMNLNLIIDPKYINDQLTSSDGAIRVAAFFVNFNRKNKRNFIIIQDKDRNITNIMIHQFKYQFKNIDQNDSKQIVIFSCLIIYYPIAWLFLSLTKLA